MAKLIERRVTADVEGDFVVFLIGMRINRFWKPGKWLPVLTAMPKMVRELEAAPDAGFLGFTMCWAGPRSPTLIQYWRSFEHLERYARRSKRDLSKIDFYVAFSLWKSACIIEGVYARYLGGALGKTDVDLDSFKTRIDAFAALADQAVARFA